MEYKGVKANERKKMNEYKAGEDQCRQNKKHVG